MLKLFWFIFLISLLPVKYKHAKQIKNRMIKLIQNLWIEISKLCSYGDELQYIFVGDVLVRQRTRVPFQYPIRRLIVRSRKVSKPRDLDLELYGCSEIWQAPRQQCCGCACQISKHGENLNYQSRDFETSRDLTIRLLIGYWNGDQKARASVDVELCFVDTDATWYIRRKKNSEMAVLRLLDIPSTL